MAAVDGGAAVLGIDYGTANTAAVLAWPDGRYVPVFFNGLPALSSAVHVNPRGEIVTGAQAWQQAALVSEGFEPAPKRRITEGRLRLGTATVEVLDVVAATLRRVGEQAAHAAGAPPGQVRMLVPAGWGPRRRTLLRQAAHRAGLPPPTLVETPVAVAAHLLAGGMSIPVGAYLAVADFGAGFEASVLRRGPAGFEVLATLAAPDGGGDHLDHLLAGHLVALLDGAATGHRHPGPAATVTMNPWPLRDAARTAKESLAHAGTVLVPMPAPQPAVILASTDLTHAATPVLQAAVTATKAAIDAAEITPDQLAGLWFIGGGAHLPQAATLLGETLHTTPTVVDEPQRAALLGAVHATTAAHQPPQPPPAQPGPPIRRALGILIPGVASLALLTQTYLAAHYEPGTGGGMQYAYVQANWGELAMAAVYALIAALTAATLIAAALPPAQPTTGQAVTAVPGAQIGAGLLAATALGMSLAALYALTGAVYFALPNGPFLRWALLPPLPIAAIVATTALLITRLGKAPTGTWDKWLSFPPTSVICAATGMIILELSISAPTYPGAATTNTVIGHLGGLLLGVGAALALARSTTMRIIIAAPLAMFTALIAGYPTTGVLGIICTTAATVWWGLRILHLLRGW